MARAKSEKPEATKPAAETTAQHEKQGDPWRSKMAMFMPDFDFSKALGSMKSPSVPDIEEVLAAYRRNMEALSEANRVALEGAQAVARRHMEIMQSTMTELTEQLRSMSLSDTPKSRAAKQADLLKHTYETAMTNMRDLGALIQRVNHDAVEKLNHRFSEAMDEMKRLIDHGAKKK